MKILYEKFFQFGCNNIASLWTENAFACTSLQNRSTLCTSIPSPSLQRTLLKGCRLSQTKASINRHGKRQRTELELVKSVNTCKGALDKQEYSCNEHLEPRLSEIGAKKMNNGLEDLKPDSGIMRSVKHSEGILT